MAYEHVLLTLPGLRANSTGLATAQFKFGKLASTAGQCVLAAAFQSTTAPTTLVGVITNKPGGGEEVELAVSGVVKVVTQSTAIAIGDWVTSDANSVAAKTTTATGGVVGRALEASSGTAGDIISILLIPGNVRY